MSINASIFRLRYKNPENIKHMNILKHFTQQNHSKRKLKKDYQKYITRIQKPLSYIFLLYPYYRIVVEERKSFYKKIRKSFSISFKNRNKIYFREKGTFHIVARTSKY